MSTKSPAAAPLSATISITTSASPEAVWEALTDVPRWPEVLPGVGSAHLEPDGALAPGAVIKTIALPGHNVVDMSYDVVSAEPIQRLVIQSSAQGYTARTAYDLSASKSSAHPHGTDVTATAIVTPVTFRKRLLSSLGRPKINESIELSVRRRTTALLELAEKISAEQNS
ncbi:MAG TPA: SRPBCC family protein [Xanthobacteraceae bacterium]|nr:SRPBCC family protein [Xanthobacteraceae bacterium]